MSEPSLELLRQVRAGFLLQGSSLAKWCAENGLSRQWVCASLTGMRRGPAAKAIMHRAVNKAGTPQKCKAA